MKIANHNNLPVDGHLSYERDRKNPTYNKMSITEETNNMMLAPWCCDKSLFSSRGLFGQ